MLSELLVVSIAAVRSINCVDGLVYVVQQKGFSKICYLLRAGLGIAYPTYGNPFVFTSFGFPGSLCFSEDHTMNTFLLISQIRS
jgi:hypothetical protein